MKLTRHPASPVLLPDPASIWESANVFNPGVLHHGGLFHMFYRAQGADWVSRIGYAVSDDGVHWNRLRQPVLVPHDESDSRGVEDPRVIEIEGVFYMTYTAYGHAAPDAAEPTHAGGAIFPMLARSHNLLTWERLGPLVWGEDNKDHVLFPRRLNGRWTAVHRRWPDVWLAQSDDLVTWPGEEMFPVFGPRPGSWDCKSVGCNGVPIETPHGWVVLYHGYGEDHVYRFGVCLLDLEEPKRVVNRPRDPVFWPERQWEIRGDLPNVVFSCANPVVDGIVYVFYGGGDHVIGLATCYLDDLVDYARHGAA